MDNLNSPKQLHKFCPFRKYRRRKFKTNANLVRKIENRAIYSMVE